MDEQVMDRFHLLSAKVSKMKATIGVVGIWIWVALHASTLAIASPPRQVITLDRGGDTPASEYVDLLKRFRDAMKAPRKTCHGLPVAAGDAGKKQFVEIQLKSKESSNIMRLAFQRSDLYFQGYADIYDNKCRYRIFDDSIPGTVQFLCGAQDINCLTEKDKAKKDLYCIGYTSNYYDMEKRGITSRDRLELNTENLESRINKLYGILKSTDKSYAKNEMEFLLMVMQMVAEAARFKYIEDKIKDKLNLKNGYKPDPRAISLEGKWDKLSKILAKNNDPIKLITLPKGMKDENNQNWEKETISNLKSKYIAMLTYQPKCKVQSPVFNLFNYYYHDLPLMWDI